LLRTWQGAWPVRVDEFVDALCGRACGGGGGSSARGRGGPGCSDDGYSADAEADEDALAGGAAAHLVGRAPTAGSKRRAPSCNSLEAYGAASAASCREVDGIAERLSRIQASPPKRRRAVGGSGSSASASGGGGVLTPANMAVMHSTPPLSWPPAREADGDMQA
jgi:hypothetical protein